MPPRNFSLKPKSFLLDLSNEIKMLYQIKGLKVLRMTFISKNYLG